MLTYVYWAWTTASRVKPLSSVHLVMHWLVPKQSNAARMASGPAMCQNAKQFLAPHPCHHSMAKWWTTDITWWEIQCNTAAMRDTYSSESQSSDAQRQGFGLTPHHFVNVRRFPGDPKDGRITPVKFLYEVGDRILIQCNTGHINTGKQKLQCTQTGSWSDRLPTCLSYRNWITEGKRGAV